MRRLVIEEVEVGRWVAESLSITLVRLHSNCIRGDFSSLLAGCW